MKEIKNVSFTTLFELKVKCEKSRTVSGGFVCLLLAAGHFYVVHFLL